MNNAAQQIGARHRAAMPRLHTTPQLLYFPIPTSAMGDVNEIWGLSLPQRPPDPSLVGSTKLMTLKQSEKKNVACFENVKIRQKTSMR